LIIHTERREVEEDGDGNGATSAAAAQLISQTSTNAVLLLYPTILVLNGVCFCSRTF
jgi:hypothetical protein